MAIDSGKKFWVGAMIALIVGNYLYRRFSGPPFLVQRWAKDHAFRILRCRYCYLDQGRFERRLGRRGVQVYHVRVVDPEGQERSAWVRCVGAWDADKTEWKWDEHAD